MTGLQSRTVVDVRTLHSLVVHDAVAARLVTGRWITIRPKPLPLVDSGLSGLLLELWRSGRMVERERSGDQVPVPASPPVAPLAPVLMVGFGMLLGDGSDIRVAHRFLQVLGLEGGRVSIAVLVGGSIGAVGGGLLGLVTNPRLLVLLMRVFAGSAVGAVAGQVAWGGIGQIGGQVAGGLVGGMAWAVWL
jgi:hypothetical protein